MISRICEGNWNPTEADGFSAQGRLGCYAVYCLGVSAIVGVVRLICALGFLIKYTFCSAQAQAERRGRAEMKNNSGVIRRGVTHIRNIGREQASRLQDEVNGVPAKRAFWRAQAMRGAIELTVIGSWYYAVQDQAIDLDEAGAVSVFGLQELSDELDREFDSIED